MQHRRFGSCRRVARLFVGAALVFVGSLSGPSVPAAAAGSSTPVRAWATSYRVPFDIAQANASVLTLDGSRLFVTGTFYTPTSDWDIVTVAFNTRNGARLWTARFNGSGNGFDHPNAIAVSPDGSRVYVTGYAQTATDDVGVTLAYGAVGGATAWTKLSSNVLGSSIAVGPSGARVYVAGNGFITALTRAAGATVWTSTGGAWTSIVPSRDGSTLYATGRNDCTTAALRTGTGAPRTTKADANGCLYLVLDPAGNDLHALGYTFLPSGYESVVISMDAQSGAIGWTTHRTGIWPRAIGTDPGGQKVFVTGTAGSECDGPGCGPFVTSAYEAGTGSEMWSGSGPNDGYAISQVVSPDGREVYATGTTLGDLTTIARDTGTGAKLWVVRYGASTAEDVPVGIAVAADGGRIYVTGTGSRVMGSDENVNTGWIEAVAYAAS